jgi:pentatricopeptide repeat domain-containing protein 1
MPRPDAVTYGTILSACERGEQWDLVLKYAEHLQERNLALDGLSLTSVLHACQQLGMAQEAMRYLELMKHASTKQSERKTSGWQRTGVRQPLKGPDGVAYRLAISACARGGLWEDGIRLLEELRQVDSVDVVAYTAAITGCEYAGEWKRAFQLLEMMRNDGVEPNEVTMASVIGACATASAGAVKKDQDPKLPKQKALQLLRVMKKDASVVDPNIVVYNAAIRACGEALDSDSCLTLLNELEEDGLEPTVVTYGSLMTAYERVGDMDGASKVFKRMREADIVPNEIIYGAAISCCRKAGEPERALLLLRKMIREELSPNVATFNTVIVAQTEGRKADLQKGLLVYKLLMSKYSKARPNRQTYNLLIRGLAANQEPSSAEAFLRKMRSDGFTPDVDLYSSTVTAYEKNGQPLKALRLMESMQEDGYDFYDIKVLNAAFKKAVKLVSVLGRGLVTQDDKDSKFDIDVKEGEDDEFIGERLSSSRVL